jgi:hypothetical protein
VNKPLPEICCPLCHLRQPYRAQTRCIHCTKEMPNFNIAVQLKGAVRGQVARPPHSVEPLDAA